MTDAARAMADMKAWHQPVRLANDRLVAELGQEPHTPLDEAMRVTLAGLGCL